MAGSSPTLCDGERLGRSSLLKPEIPARDKSIEIRTATNMKIRHRKLRPLKTRRLMILFITKYSLQAILHELFYHILLIAAKSSQNSIPMRYGDVKFSTRFTLERTKSKTGRATGRLSVSKYEENDFHSVSDCDFTRAIKISYTARRTWKSAALKYEVNQK